MTGQERSSATPLTLVFCGTFGREHPKDHVMRSLSGDLVIHPQVFNKIEHIMGQGGSPSLDFLQTINPSRTPYSLRGVTPGLTNALHGLPRPSIPVYPKALALPVVFPLPIVHGKTAVGPIAREEPQPPPTWGTWLEGTLNWILNHWGYRIITVQPVQDPTIIIPSILSTSNLLRRCATDPLNGSTRTGCVSAPGSERQGINLSSRSLHPSDTSKVSYTTHVGGFDESRYRYLHPYVPLDRLQDVAQLRAGTVAREIDARLVAATYTSSEDGKSEATLYSEPASSEAE